ncbi:MAG: ferric reductase-like transmembrane domain-containing protein [Chloroflexi bacterium]|nr:ferric reductase-like transmembrane domain-containing protein [Chloroflexota bacterium]
MGLSDRAWRFLLAALTVLSLMVAGAVGIMLAATPLGALPAQAVDGLFALSSPQALWYVTRAAGLMAYFLLWLSTAWGIAVSSKLFDPLQPRAWTYELHQFLSLLAIGFIVLHVVVLLGDHYLPFSLAEILVPFAAPYRPLWVGLGVIGLYLTLLVTITFYIRRWIGARAFRAIHYFSFIAYLMVTVHGWFAGTDSALGTTQWLYLGSALVIVFLTVYRVVMARAQLSTATAVGAR